MGSYYDCNLNVRCCVQSDARERAIQCLVDVVLPVLEELGGPEDSDTLRRQMEVRDDLDVRGNKTGETLVVLEACELPYSPDLYPEDMDARLAELTNQIVDKLRGIPALEATVGIAGYYSEREPDISGYARIPRENKGTC